MVDGRKKSENTIHINRFEAIRSGSKPGYDEVGLSSNTTAGSIDVIGAGVMIIFGAYLKPAPHIFWGKILILAHMFFGAI